MGLSRYSSGVKGLAYAILIVVLINLCQAGICYLTLISLPVSYVEDNKSISDWCIIVSWIFCLIPFIFYLKNRDKSFSLYIAKQNGNSLKDGILSVALSVALYVSFHSFEAVIHGGVVVDNYFYPKTLMSGPFVFNTILVFPFVEELLYRKYLIDAMAVSTRHVLPILIVPSVIFAIVHNSTLYSALEALAFGLILSYVYYRSKNLLITICIHSVFNAIWLFMNMYQISFEDIYPWYIQWWGYWLTLFAGTTLSTLIVIGLIRLPNPSPVARV